MEINQCVRVKSDLTVGKYYGGYTFAGGMNMFCGNTAIITKIRDKTISLKFNTISNNDDWGWTEEMLEPISLKDFLQNGDIVQYRNGDTGLFINSVFFGLSKNVVINEYSDDLTHQTKGNIDIIRISRFPKPCKYLIIEQFINNDLITKHEIWNEVPSTEMTMKELEKLVGCKIKIKF